MEYKVRTSRTYDEFADENYKLKIENKRLKSLNKELREYSLSILKTFSKKLNMNFDRLDIKKYFKECHRMSNEDLMFFNIVLICQMNDDAEKLSSAKKILDDMISIDRYEKNIVLYNKIKKIRNLIDG